MTIHMKYQILFSGKYRISIMSLLSAGYDQGVDHKGMNTTSGEATIKIDFASLLGRDVL